MNNYTQPPDPGFYGSEFATVIAPGASVMVHAHPMGVRASSKVESTLENMYRDVYDWRSGNIFMKTVEVTGPEGQITVNLQVPGFGGKAWFPKVQFYLLTFLKNNQL